MHRLVLLAGSLMFCGMAFGSGNAVATSGNAEASVSQALSAWVDPRHEAAVKQWHSLLQDLGFLSPAEDAVTSQPLALDQATRRLLDYRAQLRRQSSDNAESVLDKALAEGNLSDFLSNLTPDYRGFRQLRAAIERERAATRTPVPELSALQDFSLGQRHPNLAQLRRALAEQLGEPLSPVLAERQVWDPPFQELLKRYQSSKGLKTTGKLDTKTVKVLTAARQDPMGMMQFSARQWLQLPERMTEKAFLVNIPHYELLVLEQNSISMVVPTIVGKPQTPTPRLNSRFRSINLNPTWTPPASIVYGELLPQWRADQDSLWRQGFQLVKGSSQLKDWQEVYPANVYDVLKEYRLRQQPGSNNPLGKVRFNLTNSGAIYLHDTNNKRLFRNANRALSHGCVRVGDFDRLLQHLSASQPLPRQRRIQAAIQSGRSYTEQVTDNYEIYIVYMPAWPSHDGKVHLAQDIYDLVEKEPEYL